jgi:3-oxoacyl-[acyl-carrier protein] reductase
MDLGLKDKIALVVGASRGLGAATARQLAREGARVAISSRSAEKLSAAAAALRQETGAHVIALPGDVTQAADIERIVAGTVKQFGGLDVVVTNSGGPPAGGFDNFDDEAWLSAVNLMLMSAVRLVRCALPHLRKSSAASVLTITSVSVKQPITGLLLSNSVRLAVIGLTKTLALELGGEGIRFNSLLPASTETERIHELMAFRAQQNGTTVEEELKKQASASVLGRLSTPEEFGNVAAFLCSPAAAYLTGVMLPVDGGMYKGTL